MTEISDNMLMAYADNELSQSECAEVEKALAGNPALRNKLALYQKTRNIVHKAYSGPECEPVPARLLDAIDLTAAQPANVATSETRNAGLGANIASMASTIFGALTSSHGAGFKMATALGMAAIAGFGIGLLSGPYGFMPATSSTKPGVMVAVGSNLVASGALHEALSKVSSGEQYAIPSGTGTAMSFRPQFTFKSIDNRVCRQFQLWAKDRAGLVGVSCREKNDNWHIVMQVAQTGQNAGDDQNVRTANAKRRFKAQPIVDAFVDTLNAGNVLMKDEEAKALHRKEGSGPKGE